MIYMAATIAIVCHDCHFDGFCCCFFFLHFFLYFCCFVYGIRRSFRVCVCMSLSNSWTNYYCRMKCCWFWLQFLHRLQCLTKFQCEVNNERKKQQNICLHFRVLFRVQQTAKRRNIQEAVFLIIIFWISLKRWMQRKFHFFDTVALSIFVRKCIYFPIDLSFYDFFFHDSPVHIRIVNLVVYLAWAQCFFFSSEQKRFWPIAH